jgi:MscS family membrane protein
MSGEHDDRMLASLRPPVAVILLAIVLRILGLFGVSVLAREIWSKVAEFLAVAGVTWLLVRFSDIVSALGARRLLLKQASDKIALLAFTRRLFKAFVILIAVILLLRSAGVNVTAVLAGLGIGGVAVALAAQKTLENIFGGVSIILRDVVRVGDFCKIADQLGTIEDVGFGSTRVRTLDRTVVSVSNAQASQTSIENYTMRDKFWFHHIFGLRYDTSAGQMRQVLTEIGRMLRTHSKVEHESARIRLIEFGRSSLDVEVFAYVLVNDYAPFLEAQEDLLLRIMDIVAASGTHLALPSQISYLRDGQFRPERIDQQASETARASASTG